MHQCTEFPYAHTVLTLATAPIPDATPELAADNMDAFVEEVADRLAEHGAAELAEPVRDEAADGGGRFGYTLSAGDRSVLVLMPGVPLAQVQAWGTAAPCLQVGENWWWWPSAVTSAAGALR